MAVMLPEGIRAYRDDSAEYIVPKKYVDLMLSALETEKELLREIDFLREENEELKKTIELFKI